jgi:cytochrome P450
VARWNGPLGVCVYLRLWINGILTVFFAQEERLWIADPRAIGHFFKNSNTLYEKLGSSREVIALMIGRGLVWADGSAFSNSVPSRVLTSTGDAHKRQRRAVAPAFGPVESKGLLPYFSQSVTKVGSHLVSIQHCDRRVLHSWQTNGTN